MILRKISYSATPFNHQNKPKRKENLKYFDNIDSVCQTISAPFRPCSTVSGACTLDRNKTCLFCTGETRTRDPERHAGADQRPRLPGLSTRDARRGTGQL